jgi:hypothetical protein
MEGMFVVIALGADRAKLLLELVWTHDLGHGCTLDLNPWLSRIP